MKFSETFNPHKLNYILQNKEKFKFRVYDETYDPIKTSEKYLRKSSDGGVKVSYHQPRHRNFGRFYADNATSLQSILREIRHTISAEYYDDVDVVNAHPVILKQLCEKHDIDCEKLEDYTENREQHLVELMTANPSMTRDDVKDVFLSLLNGGQKACREVSTKTKFLKRFKNEVSSILEDMKDIYPSEYDYRKGLEPNHPNLLGRTVNAILCENENQILQSMVKFYQNADIITDNCVLCFDGVMIPKHPETAGLLENCEAYVLEKTGFAIKLKIKAMDQGFDLPPEVPEYRELLPFDPKDTFTWLDFDEKWRGVNFTSREEVIEQTRADLNRVFAKVEQGTGFVIKKTDCGDNLHDIIDMKSTFTDLYFTYQENDKPKEINFKRYLQLFSNDLNRYRSIDFAPNSTDPRLFNLWSGYQAHEVKEPDVSRIEPILTHIKEVYCEEDQESYDYFLDLLYYLLKYPEKPLGVATFMFSKRQGAGKNIILDFLEDYVFGKSLTHYTTGLETVLEKHNHLLKSKKVVIVDELASTSENFVGNFDKLKSMMTGGSLVINPKGVNQYSIKNVLGWFLISNHDDCLRIEPSDRRYFCLRVSEKYIGNKEYFQRLAATFSEETGNIFYSFIMRRGDEREVNIRIPPMNAFKREIISRGWSSSVRFLFELKENRSEFQSFYDQLEVAQIPETCVPAKDLYETYVGWCNSTHERVKSATKFGRDIATYIPKERNTAGWSYDLSRANIVNAPPQ
jgi:hypothetical protein